MKTFLLGCSLLLVCSSAFAQGDGDEVLARQRAILLGGFGPYQAPFYPEVANPLYPNVGYYSGYYDPYYYYFLGPCRTWMPQGERPVSCVQASVTFDIEEDYLKKAIVRIDGHNFGEVGNFQKRHVWPDRKLYLGADREHVIQLTRVMEDGRTQVWEDRIAPETIRLAGSRSIEIPVSEMVFATAPYGKVVNPIRETLDGRSFITGKK